MAGRVEIERRLGPAKAECESCFIPEGASRERARQHVRNTGHTVVVTVENMTVYKPSDTES
ncbi:MAG: hypothetical protein ABW022_15685 [Actinoplanes sp.]